MIIHESGAHYFQIILPIEVHLFLSNSLVDAGIHVFDRKQLYSEL